MALPGSNVSAPTRRAMIKTGTYTGNGADDRNIDIGVDLLSKSNVLVCVKNITDTQYTTLKTDHWSTEHKSIIHTADAGVETDDLQDLTTTGFEVGTSQRVNVNEKIYLYWVFWDEP